MVVVGSVIDLLLTTFIVLLFVRLIVDWVQLFARSWVPRGPALVVLEGRGVRTLDAWTREDAAANRWYQRNGFAETTRYLHVYLGDGDDPSDFTTPDGLSSPVTVFVHGRIEDEADLRARYRRVYVCRRYARDLTVR